MTDFGIGTAILVLLINLGIFTRRHETSELKSTMFERFAEKDDVGHRFDTIDKKLDRIFEELRKKI